MSDAQKRSAGLSLLGSLQTVCFLCLLLPSPAQIWFEGPGLMSAPWKQSLGVHPQSSGSECLWFSVTEGARKPEKVPQCWETKERNVGLSAAAQGKAS